MASHKIANPNPTCSGTFGQGFSFRSYFGWSFGFEVRDINAAAGYWNSAVDIRTAKLCIAS